MPHATELSLSLERACEERTSTRSLRLGMSHYLSFMLFFFISNDILHMHGQRHFCKEIVGLQVVRARTFRFLAEVYSK